MADRSIRVAGEADIGRILEIERESIAPPWTHGMLLNEIYSDDSFFLLVDDKEAIGFAIVRLAADEGELLQIAVDSAARRRGVADVLMQEAITWAGGGGASSVFLEVRGSNTPAIALYKKHGFRQVAVRRDYYDGPVEDAIVMKLCLGVR